MKIRRITVEFEDHPGQVRETPHAQVLMTPFPFPFPPPKGPELRGEVWRLYDPERRRVLGLKPLPPRP